MTPFVRCPSTLATGYSSYSPTAIKTLFDGVSVSPVLTFDGPSSEEREAKEATESFFRTQNYFPTVSDTFLTFIKVRSQKNTKAFELLTTRLNKIH